MLKKETNEGDFGFSLSHQPSWKAWAGYAFESTCYKHLNQIRRALHIDASARAGTWRYTSKAPEAPKAPEIKDDQTDQQDGSRGVLRLTCFSIGSMEQ